MINKTMLFNGFKTVVSFISIIALIFSQTLAPTLILAQEATPSATEASPEPSPEPNLSPQPQASSSAQESTAAASEEPNVVLGQVYNAAEDERVTVTFTKLPQNPGRLTIKQIKLTEEQIKISNALSDTAYDITSTMEDETFEYTLTLPAPTIHNVEVKTSEDGQNFVTVGGVTTQTDTLTITGLTHFTIFVVVGEIDSDNNVTEFDENGADVLINEFVYDTTALQDAGEWVELYNQGVNEVDLTDWRLEDGNNINDDIDLAGTIPAGGFAVFENNSWLNNTGDTINLLDNNGNLINQVSYKSSGSTVVGAQDVGNVAAGQSVGRISDGNTTWDSFPTPTQEASNRSVVYVDANGSGSNYGTQNNPFTIIQDGIDAVSEVGTVNVAEGEYEENLDIERSLTILGDPGDDSAGPGDGAPVIIGDSCPVIDIDSNDVTVSGFTIDGDGCENPVVRVNSEITRASITENEIIGGGRGINLQHGSSGNTISNNIIHGNGTGISVTDSRSNKISGNEIYSNNKGIRLQSDDDGNVSGNTISQNNLHDNRTGIYAESSLNLDELSITGNTVSLHDKEGIYLNEVSDAEVSIEDNSIINNGSTGIYLSGGGNSISSSTVTISGNTISSNEGDGIYADVITDSTFGLTDNRVESNSNNGIYICAQGECVNSTVTINRNEVNNNNGAGIYLYEILDGSTITITQNNIQGNGEESFATGIYINYVYNSTLDISDNDILENIGDGIHIVRIEEGGEGGETLVTISDNNVTDNQGYGVYMSEVSNSDVTIGEANTISNNNNAGIYLNSQVQGVGISSNTITGNGEVAETTGIVVLQALGNEAHENIISGNGSTGVQNNDGTNDFDANENYWGADSGPLHETTNPEGQGNSVTDNVLYRPFYTDEGRTTLSTSSVDPDDLSSLLDSGSFDIPDGEDSESASQIIVNEELTINVSDSGGTSSVVLPSGTVITNEDGTIDVPNLTSDDVTESSLSGLGTGVVVDGALQWGLDNIELNFSQPITLNIFVGTALNGQTLNVVRSTTGGSGWTSDGIIAPATCVVTAGICSFQATKASFYAATRTTTPTSSPASTTQALSAPNGSTPAPTCSDTKPGSAPILLSATATSPNQVTLTWSKAKDPVTYYLATYGLSSGTQQYGNPNIGGKDTTSYTVQGLSGGTTYYFKVRAGNGCAPGDFSNELSVTPAGGAVTGPASGFQEGVLGVSDTDQGNVGVGEKSAQPTAITQPPTTQQSPLNVKTVAVVVIALLVGFGIFKLLVK